LNNPPRIRPQPTNYLPNYLFNSQKYYKEKKMKKLIPLLTVLLLISGSTIAADRVVKCQIDSAGSPTYKGKCLFVPDTNGSFALLNPQKNKPLLIGITDVSVFIIEKGVAEVRGLTTDGINSRWGEAKRSTEDKACWVGEDFKVCAW
jgi:hypothetical protein